MFDDMHRNPKLNAGEMKSFLCSPVSNGNPSEQALIRRWWHETHDARGCLVWEYCLNGLYADALWFPNAECVAIEEPGQRTSIRFPLRDTEVVLCEAKMKLTPELIGQAVVYLWSAKHAGARVRETVVFAASDPFAIRGAAETLGLTVVLH